MSIHVRRILAAAFVAALASPVEGQVAQARSGESASRARVPVTIALVDELPAPGVGAVIVRNATQPPRGDIILMTPNSASARQLSAALATLLITWEADGRSPHRDATIKVVNRRGPAAWFDTEERRAESVVRRLRRAPARRVGPLGQVPAVSVQVKPIPLTRRAR